MTQWVEPGSCEIWWKKTFGNWNSVISSADNDVSDSIKREHQQRINFYGGTCFIFFRTYASLPEQNVATFGSIKWWFREQKWKTTIPKSHYIRGKEHLVCALNCGKVHLLWGQVQVILLFCVNRTHSRMLSHEKRNDSVVEKLHSPPTEHHYLSGWRLSCMTQPQGHTRRHIAHNSTWRPGPWMGGERALLAENRCFGCLPSGFRCYVRVV